MTTRPRRRPTAGKAAAVTGRHVELRLIGDPACVDAALTALADAVELTPGTRKPTRDRDGRVIQYATLTAPTTPQEGTC
jgi:hypothetical protein